ncbi:NADH:flavin oxidoreductase/NADH oxidase [Hymenobacter sp. UV11]|uniref:NADH:flavin oxidoreductase/NADH oxidase n=1 Tax=Hymenobacter sp. UV11 TaxID=1849735 RepID=UPI00105D1F17|nr:NADH:flavin oxidoreductase/NADH oxidase [Hymenobacter sp. UV11]TDN36767.1 oxidoreductase [Hymenobacter sp. UV11]TFZ63700.1 NADH:flavin oxidoreductase/NADH oxidase [Hymenobacter sp. UV11]
MSLSLFSPLQLRGLALKNRLVMSPMQQYRSPDGLVGAWHLVHLGSRAVGGVGLVITEATAVTPEGRNTPFDAGLWNEAQVAAWRPVVQFVQTQGARIAVQLWHAGGKGSHAHPAAGFHYLPPAEGGWPTKSASAVSLDQQHTAEALTRPEIQQLVADFAQAAGRAGRAGFDTIELHAGHGYLFHQFYSALVNYRTDEYGGSFDNRVRLLLETVEAIRAAIPGSMPLLVRLSAVDFSDEEHAWRLADSVRLAAALQQRGVDVVTASAGGFGMPDRAKVVPLYQVPYAAKIKAATGIVTGAVGLITTPAQANDLIASQQADLVLLARELLRDPYFPLHAAADLHADLAAVPVPGPYGRAFEAS